MRVDKGVVERCREEEEDARWESVCLSGVLDLEGELDLGGEGGCDVGFAHGGTGGGAAAGGEPAEEGVGGGGGGGGGGDEVAEGREVE